VHPLGGINDDSKNLTFNRIRKGVHSYGLSHNTFPLILNSIENNRAFYAKIFDKFSENAFKGLHKYKNRSNCFNRFIGSSG
jgi:hypothetical protein